MKSHHHNRVLNYTGIGIVVVWLFKKKCWWNRENSKEGRRNAMHFLRSISQHAQSDLSFFCKIYCIALTTTRIGAFPEPLTFLKKSSKSEWEMDDFVP